ncbi:MAG: acyl-CoA reductase [Bacteroidetes bacterium]|nr:MAG: acyl-CoA reductase [Bacteroidota bacterium]
MDLEKRIIGFVQLGVILRDPKGALDKVIDKASKKNGWFTEENIRLAISSIGEMIKEDKIRKWVDKYESLKSKEKQPEARKTGVIMAGNIPLVGFHDFMCVLMSGNIFVGKLSSDDEILLPAIAKFLVSIEPKFKDQIHFTDQPFNKTKGIAAYIATGSNNSARYFEYYFKKHPHIVRKNRNSVAVLDGNETANDLNALGKDIFQYFGMGCRNVSKIYIPEDFNLDNFFEAIVDFGEVIHHNKYYNNHQYYRTLYLLNSEKFLDNNFLMLKNTPSNSPEGGEIIASPVATLYYEHYNNKNDLFKKLLAAQEQIQCIVSHHAIPFPLERVRVRPGHTQSPELWDYADGVDTMEFLIRMK